ncbi:DgyrCDS10409 [Dimorphilus gyrociliatus]|uniref:protein O-GlcNAcase n=1 Tax=Dimorphilus gyrociliatus TaxID=2664684 RepID=A0A7I8W193_9ANNE|nr:DgyrCDS10409 [Dimorphilus gyrociliatus]
MSFLCGVCEGFYGKPWRSDQRKSLFERMNKIGLNTYLYAPKEDLKHRANWRELYTTEESDDLASLIQYAQKNNVKFIYALSPGLDISYSNNEELNKLKAKLHQVSKLGCTAFALLFDDIETKMFPEDENEFGTFAKAQCHITNAAYSDLKECDLFMFCPTEYCSTRADPDVKSSLYLQTIGSNLNNDILILWTGPKVVSKYITVDNIIELQEQIKRKPIIWDNIHANDYDQTRIYLGPYRGRESGIKEFVAGILSNPNCEFEVNFIPLHTLAQWCDPLSLPLMDDSFKEQEPAKSSETVDYHPDVALKRAIKAWVPYIYTSVGTEGITPASFDNTDFEQHKKKLKKRLSDDLINEDDLLLLAELFYLPEEYGSVGIHLLTEASWLLNNADSVNEQESNSREISTKKPICPEGRSWHRRALDFHDKHAEICDMMDKLLKIPNRAFLYEIYNYVSDLRNVLSMINSYVTWHGLGRKTREPFSRDEPEPWVKHGGLQGEFRRLLNVEGKYDLFPRKSSVPKVFTVRNFLKSDKEKLYKFFESDKELFPNFPNMLADHVVGVHIELEPSLCFILEDDFTNIISFALATINIKDFMKKAEESYIVELKKKYNLQLFPEEQLTEMERSTIERLNNRGKVHDGLCDKYPGFLHFITNSHHLADKESCVGMQKLLLTVKNYLKQNGVQGVHCCLDSSQSKIKDIYYKIGFIDFMKKKEESKSDILILKL